MAYSTLTDLKALVPEATLIKLSNDQGGATAIDAVNIASAIAQADREIDGYVGVQRRGPLDPVPGLIQTISGNLAIYNLYRRRSLVPETWESQRKSDVALLVKIAAGQISFGSDAKPAAPPQQALAHSSKKTLGGSGGLLEGY